MSAARSSLVIALAGAAVGLCPFAAAQPAVTLAVRVETHPTGLSGGPYSPERIVADEFETGQARVRYANADGSSDLPGDAEAFRLSAEATASILELVQQLEGAPEPETRPFQELTDGRIIISSDGIGRDVWLASSGVETHYFRGPGVEDRAAAIAGLLSGSVVARHPVAVAVSITALSEADPPR